MTSRVPTMLKILAMSLTAPLLALILFAHGQSVRQAEAYPVDVVGVTAPICFFLNVSDIEDPTKLLVACRQMAWDDGKSVARIADCERKPDDTCKADSPLRGDGDGVIEPEDFESMQVGANHVHQHDGTITVIAFVNDDDPVKFETNKGGFLLSGADSGGHHEVTCTDTFDLTAREFFDEDCDGDGVAGDGVVGARLEGDGDDTGEGKVTVTQEGWKTWLKFTIVGEPDEIEFTVLGDVIQTGIVDITGGEDDGIDNDEDGMEDGSGPVRRGTGDCNNGVDDGDLDVFADAEDPECADFIDEADEDEFPDGDLDDEGECPLVLSGEAFTEALGMPQKTVVIAHVLDNEGTHIAGAVISWTTDDSDKAVPAGPVVPSVDTEVLGIGSPMILCGTDDPGKITLTTRIALELTDEAEPCFEPGCGAIQVDPEAQPDDNSVEITVVGEPANIELTADPASLVCDGTASSTVKAVVTDSEGNPVANAQKVRFDVEVLGTAAPITASTLNGEASSEITPFAEASGGVPVVVTAGEAQTSILIACEEAPPPAPPAPPAPPLEGAPAGVISPPATGSGGYSQSSASLPWWTLGLLGTGIVTLASFRLAVQHRMR